MAGLLLAADDELDARDAQAFLRATFRFYA